MNCIQIKMFKKISFLFFLFLLYFPSSSNSEIIKNIKVEGNNRISSETISVFSQVSINDNLDSLEINNVLKKIYSTGYFESVNVVFKEGILFIKVIENPIIQNITYEGIKAQKIKDLITNNLKLRERSPFNEIYLLADKDQIIESLKSASYFFAKV